MNKAKEYESIIEFINRNKNYLTRLPRSSFLSLMGMLGDEYGANHPKFIPHEAWAMLSEVSKQIYEKMGYMGVGE